MTTPLSAKLLAPESRPTAPLTPRQSRIVGALLALHAGDSLGATVEFKPHLLIARRYPQGLRDIVGGGPFDWPPGHATDDTDMARGVLLAYKTIHDQRKSQRTPDSAVDQDDIDVSRIAGSNFLNWVDGKWPGRLPGSLPKDMGAATAHGLDKYRRSRDPEQAGVGHGSAGNGSLMRCLPTGLFQLDPKKLIDESVRISMITHNDFRCTTSCAVYNSIIAALIGGASADEAVQAGEAVAIRLENGLDSGVCQSITKGRAIKIADMAARGPPKEMTGQCRGYVLETLTVAISAVLDSRGLEDILVDVVRIGGDTDTNAAVAGGLLGARDGDRAIPERWTEKLQFGREFRDLALALTTD